MARKQKADTQPFTPLVFWRHLAIAQGYIGRDPLCTGPLAGSGPLQFAYQGKFWRATIQIDESGAGHHHCPCRWGECQTELGAQVGSLCPHVLAAILSSGRDELLLPYLTAGAAWLAEPGRRESVLFWHPVSNERTHEGMPFRIERARDFDGKFLYRRVEVKGR